MCVAVIHFPTFIAQLFDLRLSQQQHNAFVLLFTGSSSSEHSRISCYQTMYNHTNTPMHKDQIKTNYPRLTVNFPLNTLYARLQRSVFVDLLCLNIRKSNTITWLAKFLLIPIKLENRCPRVCRHYFVISSAMPAIIPFIAHKRMIYWILLR